MPFLFPTWGGAQRRWVGQKPKWLKISGECTAWTHINANGFRTASSGNLVCTQSFVVWWGRQTNIFHDLGWVRCVSSLLWECSWGKGFWLFGWKDLNLNIWKKWELSDKSMRKQHPWYCKCFPLPGKGPGREVVGGDAGEGQGSGIEGWVFQRGR